MKYFLSAIVILSFFVGTYFLYLYHNSLKRYFDLTETIEPFTLSENASYEATVKGINPSEHVTGLQLSETHFLSMEVSQESSPEKFQLPLLWEIKTDDELLSQGKIESIAFDPTSWNKSTRITSFTCPSNKTCTVKVTAPKSESVNLRSFPEMRIHFNLYLYKNLVVPVQVYFMAGIFSYGVSFISLLILSVIYLISKKKN